MLAIDSNILLYAYVEASPQFARRRLFDVRTALTLIACGVNAFATANLKDFQGLGFKRGRNPLEE